MKRPPLLLMLFFAIVAVVYLFRFNFWNNDLIIRSDGYAYYTYIQGALVHNDPLNTFHGSLEGDELNRSWMQEGLPGRYLPKMTMGLAYAWVPGFYLADLSAKLLDYPRDGWSRPYQLAVGFTGIFFLLFGLWVTWRILVQRFSGFVASITVILLYIGTNLLQYGSVDNSMSHVYTFALVALFIRATDLWVTRGHLKQLYLAALILGWIVLIRPTNIIVGLYVPFMLWSEGKLRYLRTYHLFVAATIAFIPIAPQLVFWKFTSGEWVHYSYQEEAFYWLSPHVWDGLFSYRNGWLLYTPLMFLAIGGLLPLRNMTSRLSIGIALILCLHVYIVFCWWCWYYGGSYSIRPMIDIYAILAIPFAAAVAWILRRKPWVWGVSFALVCAFVWNNLLQIDYLNRGVVTDSTMTGTSFWATFMNPNEPKHLHMISAYQDPDTDRLRQGLPERTAYDTTSIKNLGAITLDASLNKVRAFSPSLNVAADSIPEGQKLLIELGVSLKASNPEINQCFAVASFDMDSLNYGYFAADLQYAGADEGEYRTCKLYVRKPKGLPLGTKMTVYTWFRGEGTADLRKISARVIKVEFSEPLSMGSPGS